MNQIKSEETYGPPAPVPLYPTPIYQQSSKNQCYCSYHGSPADMHQWETQSQSPMDMTCTQTPQPPSNTFPHHPEMHNCMQQHPTYFLEGSSGDMTGCQGVAGASVHSSPKPAVDPEQKRQVRLMKNREAAKECRRKKKEYVRCLEKRVDLLEIQNRTLIEELRALKDIYSHKDAGELKRIQEEEEGIYELPSGWQHLPGDGELSEHLKAQEQHCNNTLQSMEVLHQDNPKTP
ncbi:cyclic AMP-responsive element-binding protein 1-like [Notolabrus celidotus]|uniref:cyclic AMP-responsive element-binding protein 1-like n=1 Tax=Notolabrus celidotus TaxID=1203425 RepID=UPI00148F7313|nr:cyclic AMP-responsive element-binding protein 1-like [Notolabrus celidotus]